MYSAKAESNRFKEQKTFIRSMYTMVNGQSMRGFQSGSLLAQGRDPSQRPGQRGNYFTWGCGSGAQTKCTERFTMC